MTTRVVLDIEDVLYRRAEQLARIGQRPIADVLAEAIYLDESDTWHGADSSELDRKMDQEIETFHRLHEDLWQRYPGQYVAIYEQHLVDSDPELEALYTSPTELPNEFVLIRQVEAQPEPITYLRSPRFVNGD